mmetsp:Transcript_13683/g.38619  ORF Transcript_13683/g.38619 Transcript_13683/m.38619 type:complete len:127 (-) Transcript_13683:120-500(-)
MASSIDAAGHPSAFAGRSCARGGKLEHRSGCNATVITTVRGIRQKSHRSATSECDASYACRASLLGASPFLQPTLVGTTATSRMCAFSSSTFLIVVGVVGYMLIPGLLNESSVVVIYLGVGGQKCT